MSKAKHITLPYGIEIRIRRNARDMDDGVITSKLAEHLQLWCGSKPCDEKLAAVGIRMIEEMILSHAMCGMNVTGQRYLKGVETALRILAVSQ